MEHSEGPYILKQEALGKLLRVFIAMSHLKASPAKKIFLTLLNFTLVFSKANLIKLGTHII